MWQLNASMNKDAGRAFSLWSGQGIEPMMPRDSGGSRSARPISRFPMGNTGSAPGLGSPKWGPTTLPKQQSASRVRVRRERFFDRLGHLGDRVIAWLLLVFTLPLIGAIALAIRCEGSGPILVWQQRMGPDGRLINALRFRTSPVFPAGTEWFRRNQRTRVGEVLWRTHMDALPMLINVLRGEMTVFGSRKRARLLG